MQDVPLLCHFGTCPNPVCPQVWQNVTALVLAIFPYLCLLFKTTNFRFRVQLRLLNDLDEKDCLSNSTVFYFEFSSPSIPFLFLIAAHNLQAISMMVHHRKGSCCCWRMRFSPANFLFSCCKTATTLRWKVDGCSIKNFRTRNLEICFLLKERLTSSILLAVSSIVSLHFHLCLLFLPASSLNDSSIWLKEI